MESKHHKNSLKIQFTIPQSLRKEVQHIAMTQFGPVRVQNGCCGINLLKNFEDQNQFTWEETWSSREFLKKRVKSDNFRPVLALIDMSIGSPTITINEVLDEEGMSWITKAREKRNS